MRINRVVKPSVLGGAIVCGVLIGTLGARFVQAHSHGPLAVHKYPVNSSGETYGSDSWIPGGTLNALALEPDLIKARATNGNIGYVKSSDLNGPIPQTPQEAVALDAKNKGPRTIHVYASNGTTIIGSFIISGTSREYTLQQGRAINRHR